LETPRAHKMEIIITFDKIDDENDELIFVVVDDDFLIYERYEKQIKIIMRLFNPNTSVYIFMIEREREMR